MLIKAFEGKQLPCFLSRSSFVLLVSCREEIVKNFRTFQLWLITLAPLPWNGILRTWKFELCQWRRRWSRWYCRWVCYLDLLSKYFGRTRRVNSSSLTLEWLGWYLKISTWFMKDAVFEQKQIKLWYKLCLMAK